ncbi:MAG: SAM-dependent methyltransferase [Allobaculum sp.]|nr:SAM-dependent methyltransferase [Allobaculum sp.]
MAEQEMKEKIIEQIQKMSGSYTPYTIFTDWVAMMALSIQNACTMPYGSLWKAREDKYMEISKKYKEGELELLGEMMGMLTLEFGDTGPRDILGEVYMAAGCGSKVTGQFFTPFHVSELCARVSLENIQGSDSVITINEPSAGGGGMIIAAAKALSDKGINYQRRMDVTAQDLDWNGVYMTYVQLSLLGIRARVIQGNTLTEPYTGAGYPQDRVLKTPAYMGVLI